MNDLIGPVPNGEMARGAALAVIGYLDSRPEEQRPALYATYVARLKNVYPGFFDDIPDTYDAAFFADARFQAFGNAPHEAVERFLFAGLQLNQESPDHGHKDKVH